MNKHPDMPPAAVKEPTASGLAAPRSRRLRQLLLALLLLAAGLAGFKTIMAIAPEPTVRKAAIRALPVRVVAARLRAMRPTWTFYGQVVAARQTWLQVPLSGRIVKVSANWRDGARVRKGEELLRIDDFSFRAAVAQAEAAVEEARARLKEAKTAVRAQRRLLDEAKAQLIVAEREFDRVRELVKRGAMPAARRDQQQRQFLSAREKLAQREQALASAEARLAQQRAALTRLQWQLKKARDDLARTVLRAPFSGRLAEVRAQLGQQASPAAQLARLVGEQGREVRFLVSEERLNAIARAKERLRGRAVEILVPGRTGALMLAGKVLREGAEVSRGQGAVRLFAGVDDPARAAWLKPGGFVEVRMKGPLLHRVALLPEAALQDESAVYVVREGRIARKRVRVLGGEGGRVIVAGLNDGEQVVAHRVAPPKPGQPVKILARVSG